MSSLSSHDSVLTSSYSWLLYLVTYIKKMGCAIFKFSSVNVEGEKYSIIRQIGEGGFSTIDLAENARTKQKVAIKRITCHSIEDQNAAKFEIEVHKKHQHENIIRLLASQIDGEADIVHNLTSEALLVLPYYPDGTLQDLLDTLREKKPIQYLTEYQVLRLLLGVSAGLRELHSANPPLAHRDIKPQNVLLDPSSGLKGNKTNDSSATKNCDYSPILMDLGSVAVARVTVKNTRDAQFLQDTAAEKCSMAYRPPELYLVPSVCEITERTDIWSLGCLLYALMYLKGPFDSVFERGDSVALATQNGIGKLPDLGSSGPDYSEDLKDLVRKMTNHDINFRPSIESIIEEIESLLSCVKPSNKEAYDIC